MKTILTQMGVSRRAFRVLRWEQTPGTGLKYTAMVLLAGFALAGLPVQLQAQEAPAFFRQNCASCHTIGGGRLTGPDLKEVTVRKDRGWLGQFLLNPQAVISSGDPYALKLLEEARNVIMPTVAGVDRARAEALLDLIEAESKLEKSQFIGVQISDRPFTAADIALGRRIFRGDQRLANGGSACIGCHSIAGDGGMGGGKLGPSLTKVFERLLGRRNLAAWLQAPATNTMQPVFKQHPMKPEEILPLIALFEDAARSGTAESRIGQLNFFLMGLGGAAVGLVIFDFAWKQRFRAVRRPLVERRRGGKSA